MRCHLFELLRLFFFFLIFDLKNESYKKRNPLYPKKDCNWVANTTKPCLVLMTWEVPLQKLTCKCYKVVQNETCRPSCRLSNEFAGDCPELGSFNETDLVFSVSQESCLIGTKPPWWYDVNLKVFIFECATNCYFFFSHLLFWLFYNKNCHP